MSRLPKAPLIEVIFELRWNSLDQNDHYFQGDLYPLIKDKYPHRESVVLPGMPAGSFVFGGPTHRFRAEPNGYPLIQAGPGVLTVNTIDSKYSWTEYEGWIIEVLKKLNQIYTFNNNHNVRLTLQYIDLIKFDFTKDDVISFLKDNLHVTVSQQFYPTKSAAKNVGLALLYENELGSLNIGISRGQNNLREDGIAIQTNLTSGIIVPEIGVVSDWLRKAHKLTSDLFKEMTKGKLQNDFAG